MRLKEIYTFEEVAEALKVSKPTLKEFFRQGRIKYILIGKRRRVGEDELKYILSNGLRDYSDEFREKSRKKRAATRARAKEKEIAAGTCHPKKRAGKAKSGKA